MLILSRKLDESVYVGNDIVIKVVKIKGNVVGLGIEAPTNVKIMRSELLAREPQTPEVCPKAERRTSPLGAFTIAS